MVAFEEDHVFQELAALGPAENLVVGWAQGIRLNRVKPCSHLGVTRCPFYAEDGLQIVGFGDPSTVECKEAWILESKHGIARHEAIRQGDFIVTVAHFGNLLEGLSNGPICASAFKCLRTLVLRSHRRSFSRCLWNCLLVMET